MKSRSLPLTLKCELQTRKTQPTLKIARVHHIGVLCQLLQLIGTAETVRFLAEYDAHIHHNGKKPEKLSSSTNHIRLVIGTQIIECGFNLSSLTTAGKAASRGLQLTISPPKHDPISDYIRANHGKSVNGTYLVGGENMVAQLVLHIDVDPRANTSMTNGIVNVPPVVDEAKPSKQITIARNSKRKSISSRLRVKILERDEHSCKKCGARPGDLNQCGKKVRLEIGHIISVADGGSNEESNLQAECFDCNRGKGKYSDFGLLITAV